MTRLFDPKRHEPLCADPWDPGVARDAVEAIARDVLGAEQGGMWRPHPLDDDATEPESTLYIGAAGVLWGLWFLAGEGVIAEKAEWSRWAQELPARYRERPDGGSWVASHLIGEAGVLLAALRAGGGEEVSERLLAVVTGNVDNPAREILWGAAGTAVTSLLARELTGAERWSEAFRQSASALMAEWRWHEKEQCHLWTQEIRGERACFLGAAHGLAGNVFALLRGLDLLPEVDRVTVLSRAKLALGRTAALEDGQASWRAAVGVSTDLLQWCHGAPGVITSLGPALADSELDELLVRAGELVWRAGPLRKGPGLCHGTAGNGAAFLTLFTRTGDEMWLERARRFAMHSLRQVAAARDRFGQGRYSLWTGDVGVAVYLLQCLNGRSGVPSLDF